MTTPRTGRPAYTLLEILLAAAIGALLLYAVYAAIDLQMRSAQEGRDRIERTTLARTLLAQMGNDVSLSLGTIDPSRYRPARGRGSSGSTSGTPTTGSTAPTGGTTPATTTGGSTSTTPTTGGGTTPTTTTDSNARVNFNLFVQGDATVLTLYVSRFPRELHAARRGDDGLPLVSDLRRITYWLAGDPDAPLGLARVEVKVATSEDALGPAVPEGLDEAAFVRAPEVQRLRFSYFDGSAWQEAWDGSAVGSDGYTPIGPPLAIAIEIGVAPPGPLTPVVDEARLTWHRHVVAVPVANGPTQQSTDPATTSP